MNTGRTAPFNSIRSFWGFMWMTFLKKGPNAIRYMQIDPARYVGSIGRLRRNPAEPLPVRTREVRQMAEKRMIAFIAW